MRDHPNVMSDSMGGKRAGGPSAGRDPISAAKSAKKVAAAPAETRAAVPATPGEVLTEGRDPIATPVV